MKVSIIGYGYVGKAMYNFFSNNYETIKYDPFVEEIKTSKDDVNSTDVAVVCAPTPRAENGECDLTAVHEVLTWLNTDLIIIKSTVEVGTTKKLKEQYPNLNIVFSPEFAGESTYWSEYKFHNAVIESPWFIFGGSKKDTSKAVDLYMKIGGPTKKYVQCTTDEAEMTKYMANVFYATKVLFCYEMAELCGSMDIDYNTVRELWQLDPRVSPMHTSVFKDNDYPFSGKCFPKDVSALVELSKKVGYDGSLLKEVQDSNERIMKLRKERREKLD